MAHSLDGKFAGLERSCCARWLVKEEILFLLLNWRQLPFLQRPVPTPPTSGTLVIVNTSQVVDYKNDGLNWQKKKGSEVKVREDRIKLVINRETVILGSYAHSSDIPSFHRRSYVLREHTEDIVLVHYFDERNKTAKLKKHARTSSSKSCLLDQPNQNDLVMPVDNLNGTPFEFDNNNSMNLVNGVILNDLNSNNHHNVDKDLDFFAATDLDDILMEDCLILADSDDNAFVQVSDCDTFGNIQNQKNKISSPFGVINSNVDSSMAPLPLPVSMESDNSFNSVNGNGKDAMFNEKISCLEARINMLEKNRSFEGEDSNKVLNIGKGISSISTIKNKNCITEGSLVKICDFSPDWDFQAGGAKVLIILQEKIISTSEQALYIQFGVTKVPAEYISECALRCTAPQSANCGFVELFVVRKEKSLIFKDSYEWLKCTDIHRFNFRRNAALETTLIDHPATSSKRKKNEKRARKPTSHVTANRGVVTHKLNKGTAEVSPKAITDNSRNNSVIIPTRNPTGVSYPICSPTGSSEHEREFKIRVVERLSEFHRDLSSRVDKEDDFLDDSDVVKVSDSDLEILSDQLIERVVKQLVLLAESNEELLEELNSLDEMGLTLLHYVCFYNYVPLVELLLEHGAQVNQCDGAPNGGQTCLHFAAACGNSQIVQILLQQPDIDVLIKDAEGFTPADRAEKNGQLAIASYLRLIEKDMKDQALVTNLEEMKKSHSCGDFSFSSASSSPDSSPNRSPSYFTKISSSVNRSSSPLVLDPPYDNSTATNSPDVSGSGSQRHNRKMLLGAFSSMSLHDKCALSLGMSRDSLDGGGAGDLDDLFSDTTSDEYSEVDTNKNLEAAMKLMCPEELVSLEEEAKVIQHNVRAWFLRKSYKNMRETTKKLHEATQTMVLQQELDNSSSSNIKNSSLDLDDVDSESGRIGIKRERAAVTVQAATRSMLARRNYLQTRNVTIKMQAATRGVLIRKNFARMKTQALASLVIQRNMRLWLDPNNTNSTNFNEPATKKGCAD